MIVPFTRFAIYRFLTVWFFVVVLFGVPASGAASSGTIVVLGDSLSAAYGIDVSAGWVYLLQQRLNEHRLPYKVVNASVSGDTTAGGVARLPKLLAEHRPAVVVIELGGNDGLRGLPPEQAKKNLATMISRAKESGVKVLVLGVRLPPNFGTRYNQRFQKIYGDVAAEQRVPVVPFMLQGVPLDGAYLQPDGIHPTAKAQPIILENVWSKLKAMVQARTSAS